MKRSTDRILTTHVGSLIRPDSIRRFLRAKQKGEGYDAAAHAQNLKDTVAEVVRQQAEVGVDVVSDGEFGKGISWSQYVIERVAGFERRPFTPSGNPFQAGADRARFPEFYKELDAVDHRDIVSDTVAVAPIRYTGQNLLQQDIDNFKAALTKVKVVEGFLPVAAPASVIPDRKNEYYKSEEDLAEAIGQAMHVEYKQIADNGLLVQLDDARAAVTYDRMVPPASFQDYRKRVRLYQDVLNRATDGIPTEKIRYHVCWGSWPGPHTTDVPAKDIMDLILRVRAGAYVLEMANPRHEHEWRVWETVKLPKGAVLIPGVISHATNVVEHPELVAERIVRLANIVGRENVIAGTDCGFAQGPFHRRVHPSIMWAKLEAMAEGARIASRELWGKKAA
jgi:5-methyltetrahydropteroyltriglutamate--homocysteine methyltransferase